MVRRPLLVLVAVAVALPGCKRDGASRVYDQAGNVQTAHAVAFTILQINDAYEVAPVESGQRGGIARVATVLRSLKQENPQTLFVLPGDFLSPSAIGVTTVDGQPVAGRQMVEALNAAGLDYATFGNHEFDLGYEQIVARISESRFKWIGSNVFDGPGHRFPNTMENQVVTFTNAAGDRVRVGLFSLCLDLAKKPYVTYVDPFQTAAAEVASLRDRADFIVALTHQSIADDRKLISEVDGIDLVLGAHEHENMEVVAGARQVPIYKADSNVKTVYVHRFRYDAEHKTTTHQSRLVPIDATIAEDPATKAVVDKWVGKTYAALRAQGLEPTEVVGIARETLDGAEASVRRHATNYTALIGEAFRLAAPDADAVVYGSGSIRIDDHILPGPITAFDVLRTFPFGGDVVPVRVSGAVLKRALDQGEANMGSGGYLLTVNLVRAAPAGAWLLRGVPLEDQATYKVLFGDFLLTGQEHGLAFLNAAVPANGLTKLGNGVSVRQLFTDQLRAGMRAQSPGSAAPLRPAPAHAGPP